MFPAFAVKVSGLFSAGLVIVQANPLLLIAGLVVANCIMVTIYVCSTIYQSKKRIEILKEFSNEVMISIDLKTRGLLNEIDTYLQSYKAEFFDSLNTGINSRKETFDKVLSGAGKYLSHFEEEYKKLNLLKEECDSILNKMMSFEPLVGSRKELKLQEKENENPNLNELTESPQNTKSRSVFNLFKPSITPGRVLYSPTQINSNSRSQYNPQIVDFDQEENLLPLNNFAISTPNTTSVNMNISHASSARSK